MMARVISEELVSMEVSYNTLTAYYRSNVHPHIGYKQGIYECWRERHFNRLND